MECGLEIPRVTLHVLRKYTVKKFSYLVGFRSGSRVREQSIWDVFRRLLALLDSKAPGSELTLK